jgi:hypothetical protein
VGYQVERVFLRSHCRSGSAVFVVACSFCGTQELIGKKYNRPRN